MKSSLIDKLEIKERLVRRGKLSRILSAPFKYLKSIRSRSGKRHSIQTCQLFTKDYFKVLLPSGNDIYLFGIKTHDSEIRLAKFLIHQLQPNHTFLDVGAHFGYFSVLAAQLVTAKGRVHAFEPSKRTYSVLKSNTAAFPNILTHHVAVGEHADQITFQELPVYYSEYNSIHHDQYKNEDWYVKQKLEQYELPLICLDDFIRNEKLEVHMIKMDVEGAELDVILGMSDLLQNNEPTIVMEYSFSSSNNEAHKKAVKELMNQGFVLNRIRSDGSLEKIEPETLFTINLEDSDNIVFKKEEL